MFLTFASSIGKVCSMTAAEREEYHDILDDLKEQRTLLRAALKAAIPNAEIQTYSLTDAEGKPVRPPRRDPEAIMKSIESLNRQIFVLFAIDR